MDIDIEYDSECKISIPVHTYEYRLQYLYISVHIRAQYSSVHRIDVLVNYITIKLYCNMRHTKGLGGGKLQEGKSKMTVQLYLKIGEYFMYWGKVEAQFFHSWMWNLMCRSMNVFHVTAGALGWAGDCISVEFGVDKVRTDGGKNKTAMVKHVFANPFRPHVSFCFHDIHIYATDLRHNTFTPHIYARNLKFTPHIYATHLRHTFTPHIYSRNLRHTHDCRLVLLLHSEC